MNKLKLPIIKESISRYKPLSMDDYLKFVRFNLQYTVNKEVVREWKKLLFVNVPFSLKGENRVIAAATSMTRPSQKKLKQRE